jgi:hypothetical protein
VDVHHRGCVTEKVRENNRRAFTDQLTFGQRRRFIRMRQRELGGRATVPVLSAAS